MSPREAFRQPSKGDTRRRVFLNKSMPEDMSMPVPTGAAATQSVRAYVLIQSVPGKRRHVQEMVQELDGIVEADPVEGPFDLIAQADVTNSRDLGSILDQLRRATKGVLRALPCIVRAEG